jgi:hypothetical protein
MVFSKCYIVRDIVRASLQLKSLFCSKMDKVSSAFGDKTNFCVKWQWQESESETILLRMLVVD